MKINESHLRRIICEEIDEMTSSQEIDFALKAEFIRGQKHAEKAIANWLRDVAETMNERGNRASGIVEDLADSVEQGEWQA
jgi:hypothetical protein